MSLLGQMRKSVYSKHVFTVSYTGNFVFFGQGTEILAGGIFLYSQY